MPENNDIFSQDILTFVQKNTSDAESVISIKSLAGGNLNKVWRVQTAHQSFIVKYAPPYIASQPNIPLDNSRIEFESGVLRRFKNDQQFHPLISGPVTVPNWHAFDPDKQLLLMEDLGDHPTLLTEIPVGEKQNNRPAKELGLFMARLHMYTFENRKLQAQFNNVPVQKTRHKVQYTQCRAFLERAEVAPRHAEKAGNRCLKLGRILQEPGICLIMGDLWPASILVRTGDLGLIDWEMTHFGRPIQDIAHLDAHLWMMQHRAPDSARQLSITVFRDTFLEYYHNMLEQNRLLCKEFNRSYYRIHFGAEILARTVGAFQAGYLYDGLNPGSPEIQEAVETAMKYILG